jgi:hypothetical protein
MRHGIQPREAGPPARFLKAALCGGLGMLRLGAEAMGGALTDRGDRGPAAGLRELGNKLEVCQRFQLTLAEVGATEGAPLPLAEAVRRAGDRGRFAGVWLTEGVGHALTETAWRGPLPPRGLLTTIEADGIPAEAWIPLHTGMGLALASRVLRTEGRDAARQTLGLCLESSLPGYARAAFEGLGFVACNLHPRAVPEIDRQLARAAPDLVGYFWHGVGRGLYFSPGRIAPGSTGAALAAAATGPPHDLGRSNALAGLAWAVTLVNLRHPEVLESLLPGHLRWAAPLADGISSAVAVWCDAAGPDEEHLTAFLGHRPANPEVEEIWRRLVAEPCRKAMRRQPDLRRSRRLEELFHCRTSGGLP